MTLDQFGIEAPPAGLYDFSQQFSTGLDGFAAVKSADIQAFHALGFMVIHNAFDQSAIASAKAGLRHLILHPAADNIMYERAAADDLAERTVEARLDSVRKLMPIAPYDQRLKAISQDAHLLALLERILGEPPALTQDMALLKPPRIGREKPWHQDLAYFDYPKDALIIGVWIALDAAAPANGCMMLIPGSHHQGPMLHWTRRDWQICDTDVQAGRILAVPMPPGACLLFHCLLHHGTPPSRSPDRRWALQYHYRPRSLQPLPNSDYRLSVFGANGEDASC